MQREVLQVIRDLSKSEDFDLVLSDGVLHASDKVDITDEVLRRLGP